MLEIDFSKDGQNWQKAEYKTAADFLAAEYLEVPPFEDYYRVKQVLLDGEVLILEDATIGGLFNALNH
ncbi:hypothetical protein [Enterococcus timonensis]|uniref:hypothetical protein n=1 Tax=Enterococcus timonensis TaxID=1852364 RepID=UPI0008DAB0C7|nr:hypothetical protein [Enterococcus timonensis]